MTNTLDIIEIGHPTLREVARELSSDEIADTATQQFFDDLIATKREANGAGIAATRATRIRSGSRQKSSLSIQTGISSNGTDQSGN